MRQVSAVGGLWNSPETQAERKHLSSRRAGRKYRHTETPRFSALAVIGSGWQPTWHRHF